MNKHHTAKSMSSLLTTTEGIPGVCAGDSVSAIRVGVAWTCAVLVDLVGVAECSLVAVVWTFRSGDAGNIVLLDFTNIWGLEGGLTWRGDTDCDIFDIVLGGKACICGVCFDVDGRSLLVSPVCLGIGANLTGLGGLASFGIASRFRGDGDATPAGLNEDICRGDPALWSGDTFNSCLVSFTAGNAGAIKGLFAI